MEPISLIALGMTALGFFGRKAKRDAAHECASAARRRAAAQRSAQKQSVETATAATALASDRAAVATWLLPMVLEAAQSLGVSAQVHGSPNALFGARTRAELQAMIKKIMRSFPLTQFKGDAVLLTAGVSALLLKGLLHLDKAAVLPMPALHQTVGQTLTGFDLPGADTFSHALGSVASMPVADLVADSLIVLSVFRVWTTFNSASQLASDAADHDRAAASLANEEHELCRLQRGIDAMKFDQQELGYQAYKQVAISRAVARKGASAHARATAVRKLISASSAWWSILQREPEPA